MTTMPADIREYLLDRFRTDATTLRQRADSLNDVSKPSPGPNAALSTAMADACDHVVALAEELPQHVSVHVMLDALKVLVPKLMQVANSPTVVASPSIRAVFMGACTRAQELIAAETNATEPSATEPDEADYDRE